MTVSNPSEPDSRTAQTAQATSGGRLNLTRIGCTAALVMVVLVLLGMLPRWKARAALRAQVRQAAGSYVTVLHAAPGTNGQALLLPAEVCAYAEAPVYARASGYLKKLPADLGQRVKEGELLAEIDTPELDRQLEQTKAELAHAEATFALAKTSAERWQELLKTASVSEQETTEKTAELAMQTAKVNATKAQLQRLEELERFKRVVAPFEGTVTVRKVEVGELIESGTARVLFRLAQTSKLRVFVRVPQASAGLIAPGQSANLCFSEKPARLFPAKVVRSAGVIEADSRTLLTELEVDNAKGEIVAGAYAQVQFQLPPDSTKLVVPANTLLFRPEGIQLGTVGEDGRVQLRSVTLGKDLGTHLEILSGISASDRIILNPPDSLVAGELVQIVEGKDKTAK